jgi:cation transport regulator ChaC
MQQNDPIYYFAYGSNMNSQDLEKWCSEHQAKIDLKNPRVAYLKGFQLAFTHKSNRRNGGVADIVRKENEITWGVLFDTDKTSLDKIDQKEGVAAGVYRQFKVDVLVDGKLIPNVISYEVIKKGNYPPSGEYLDVIINGAEDHQLPKDYVDKLMALKISK